MNADGLKLVALAVVSTLVVGALAVLGPRWLGSAAGPEGELVTALKKAEASGFELKVPGTAAQLTSRKVSYQRLSVKVESTRALITATLDFEGTLGQTSVSSLGVEQVSFVLRDDEWVPEAGWAPRLTRAVQALERRRRALEGSGQVPDAGDLTQVARLRSVEGRQLSAVAWYLRLDRGGATVTEDSRLVGSLPDRPVDERATRRLVLVEGDGGEFFFPNGFM